MKLTLLMFILISIFGCSRIRIIDKPITLIGELPNRISIEDYKSIVDTFGLFGVYKAPDYYGGLNPKYQMALSYSNTEMEDCLYYSGGMNQLCENLVVKINNNYKHLKSKSDFQKCFAPIETEQEALSYVSIWTGTTPIYNFEIKSRYRTFVKEVHKSFSQKVDSGFITMTYYYSLFGGGPHSYYSVKSFVDFNGNVTDIERMRIYEDPEEDGMRVY